MSKRFAFLCVLALLCAASVHTFAQGGRYDTWAVDSNNHFVASPTVRVCTYSAPWSSATAYVTGNTVTYNGGFYTALASSTNVTPGTDPTKWQSGNCSPLASIYADKSLATAQANPFNGDAFGNYGWFAAPGTYTAQVNGYTYSATNGGDASQPGNNVFTGSGNAFTILRGRIDATQFAGADMCAKVNAAWTYAVGLGLGYGEVDATGFHGRQDVSTNCFASMPITPTAVQGSIGYLKLAPDVKIVTSVTQNPPSDVIVDGGSIWVWPVLGSSQFASQMGAQFIAADTFNWATQKAVITYGYTGGTTNPRGIWLQNVGVNCISPSGTYTSGSIGIYNAVAQESSGGEGVFVNGCTVGIRQEVSGTFGGSQNSGQWKRLTITAVGVPTTETGWIGFDYCSISGNCAKSRGIDGASIAGPTGGAPGSVGIAVNSGGFAVRNASIEEATYGVELGKTHSALGVTLDNIDGQGHTDFNMTAVVHVVSGSITSFTAQQITAASQQRTDYVIQDEGTGGLSLCGQSSVLVGSPCNGATLITPNLAFYSCSYQTGYGNTRTCMWNTPAAASNMSITGSAGSAASASSCPTCFAGETSPAAGASYTVSNSDRFRYVLMNPNSTAGVTATLPATIPDANWSATVVNISTAFPAFINPNGKNMNGTTVNWTVPPQTSCTISTQGTSYHAACGNGQNSFINMPNVLTFSQTTSTGDQNIGCRISGGICPPGMYRITLHVTVTAAGTAGTMQPYCGYVDSSGTIHNPVNLTPLGLSTTSLTTIGNSYAGQCVVESNGASNLKYGVTLSGATGTPSLRVNASAERLSIQ